MTNLAALLATWENWSARETLVRARTSAADADTRTCITDSLTSSPAPSALDALRDSAELVELLTGWRWQAMYAARRDGASWQQIALTVGSTDEQARDDFARVLDCQEDVLGRDVSNYRAVLAEPGT